MPIPAFTDLIRPIGSFLFLLAKKSKLKLVDENVSILLMLSQKCLFKDDEFSNHQTMFKSSRMLIIDRLTYISEILNDLKPKSFLLKLINTLVSVGNG